MTANSTIYNATTTASLSGTSSLLSAEAPGSGSTSDNTPYTGDTITLGGTATGTYASKDVGTGIAITVSGNTLSGAQASDYTLVQQTGLSANITPKTITVSGLSANSTIYNATTNASLSGTAGLLSAEAPGSGSTSDNTPYTGDTVSVSGSAVGTYASKDVGTGIAITVSGNTLGGAQASDYTLVQQSGISANITPKTITVSGLTANSTVYNATTTASLSGTSSLLSAEAPGSGSTSDNTPYTGDTITLGGTPAGTYVSKDVGTGIAITVSGNTLSGAQSSDYTLVQQTGLSANITPKTITASGLTANSTVYNATTNASLSGTSSLLSAEAPGSGSTSDNTPYTGDTITLGGTPAGTYASKDVGTGITITVSGNTLSGAQASDYTLVQQTGLSANITPKTITVSGLTANSTIYNATTNASLSGTAGLLSAEAPGAGSTADNTPYTGDTVSVNGSAVGIYASKDVGTGIAITVSGNTLSGAQASDYTLVQQTGLSANITPKTITVSGLTANSTIYNATTTASLSGTSSLLSAEAPGSEST